MDDKPEGTFKCLVCKTICNGSKLRRDPSRLGCPFVCSDPFCGANVLKVKKGASDDKEQACKRVDVGKPSAQSVGREIAAQTPRFVLACASGYHPKNSMRLIGSKYPSHEPEEHCPFEIMDREKICRKCLFSVIEREKWFQRFVAPPKSEFEILKEKQRAKR